MHFAVVLKPHVNVCFHSVYQHTLSTMRPLDELWDTVPSLFKLAGFIFFNS